LYSFENRLHQPAVQNETYFIKKKKKGSELKNIKQFFISEHKKKCISSRTWKTL